ncbi:MAG: carboxylate--amine ligase, partial [Anaerolineae bacterium]|nr:carboxylate--amine ligase [Anaerolineae bacterium]
MNLVLISSHFSPIFSNLAVTARQTGLHVLGIADTPCDELIPALRNALAGYYFVTNLPHIDELTRACGYFAYKYGKIDRLDSHSK